MRGSVLALPFVMIVIWGLLVIVVIIFNAKGKKTRRGHGSTCAAWLVSGVAFFVDARVQEDTKMPERVNVIIQGSKYIK